MEKHHSNSHYFKGKKLQSKIFNLVNIKKNKIDKHNLKKKRGNEKKRCKKNKKK